jgi:type IV secretory pathway VirB2 component (pilin)
VILVEITHSAVDAARWAAANLAVYDPQPRGDTSWTAPLEKLLDWLMWIFTAAAVAGVILTGIRMVLAHRKGDEANVGQLVWVLVGCVLAGSAAQIVAALTGA